MIFLNHQTVIAVFGNMVNRCYKLHSLFRFHFRLVILRHWMKTLIDKFVYKCRCYRLHTLVCSNNRKCFEAWDSAAATPWMQANWILYWMKLNRRRLS